ncbi:uncharacterized protein TM35_000015500 [Trypanosoma theileri]|uniref:Uncharacterized protein n=1 Tax=Trypanosoma theileri TaxID=67003 RepID=A0A1X0PAM2_9TRYP|nr:uncharacterized protein TM35_000015500 [Trypanosoma theileri]ORC93673.1 hypothetical protein TM35_000015500 [Trypanosoma theileri]
MMSLSAYVYPSSGNTASFPSPLMDCTSAIHNSDNIQNSTPYYSGRKSAATAAFQERLKGIPIVIAEKQPLNAPAPRRRTNDPYRDTAPDGSPCVPKSPFTTEMGFLMSYKEDDVSSIDTSLASPMHSAFTAMPPQNKSHNNIHNNNNNNNNSSNNNNNHHHHNNSTVRSSAWTSCLPPAPRSAASTTFTHRPPPFTTTIVTPSAFHHHNSNANTVDMNTSEYNSTKRGESRCVKNHSTTHSSHSGNSSTPLTSTITTSVTHVRCKRVYVNGRPVTVWLNEDEQPQ